MGSYTRRSVLAAPPALALLGCWGWAEAPDAWKLVPPLLASTTSNDLLKPLVALVQEGMDPRSIAEVLALHAVQRVESAAVGGGIASHALLGVLPSSVLCDHLPPQRAALPVLQAALFVAREVERSPYGLSPFHLPPVPDGRGNPSDLQSALRDDNMYDAEALAATLARTAPLAVLDAVAERATRYFGHGGHGAIFTAHAAAWAQRRPSLQALWRAPIRYCTSYVMEDDTVARAASIAPPTASALVDRAANLVCSLRSGSFPTELHLFTAAAAVADVTARSTHREELLRRGWAWLDLAMDGATDIGPLDTGPPLQPRSPPGAPLAYVADAIRGDWPDGPAAIRGYLDAGHPPTPLRALLAEAAVIAGRTSIQHGPKVAAAALATGHEPVAGWVGPYLEHLDPEYELLLDALGLDPHPLLR